MPRFPLRSVALICQASLWAVRLVSSRTMVKVPCTPITGA